MSAPSTSVIIASLGRNALLETTLEEVRRQVEEIEGEIVLVINDAEEEFSESQRKAWTEQVDHLLFVATPGKSYALNAALKVARGEFLAFTDDDALPARDWLEKLVAPLRADPELMGCGGRVLPVYPVGGPPTWYRRLVARSDSTFLGPHHDLGPEPQVYEPDGFTVPFGANCAFRRSAFEEHRYRPDLGPSRETGLRGGEDTELACRLLLEGKRLEYRPEPVVYHPVTHDRMTMEYVWQGYFIQGVEIVRLRRIFGMPVKSSSKLRLILFRQRVRIFWATLRLRLKRRLRSRLRCQFLRGMLHEIAVGGD